MDSYNFFMRLKKFFSNKYCRRTLIIFLILVLFWCVGKCSAYDDRLGIKMEDQTFYEWSSRGCFIFQVQKGGSYHFIVNPQTAQLYRTYVVVSQEYPANGVQFQTYLGTLETTGLNFDYTATSDGYLTIGMEPKSGQSATITPIGRDMNYVMNDLTSSFDLWGVFSDSIPYLVVVVLSAFGFYIIFKLIRRVRK